MYKLFLTLLISVMVIPQAFAKTECFLAKENGQIISEAGDCSIRQPPCSTFKVAISLMGYNEGILTDETHPEWPFKVGYVNDIKAWETPQNPTTWMRNSCVWYSQLITQMLGMEKFQKYVESFQYGNQDVSGDPGQNNGLTHAWLSSSLRISGEEQMSFLERLLASDLPVSPSAQEMTRHILYIEELPDGWKLYGKTGSGYQMDEKGSSNPKLPVGWFIGWIEKEAQKILVVDCEDAKEDQPSAGLRAKAVATEKALQLIQ